MKNVRSLIACLIVVISFIACSPNHDDEVIPQAEEPQTEAFEIKNDHAVKPKKGDDR